MRVRICAVARDDTQHATILQRVRTGSEAFDCDGHRITRRSGERLGVLLKSGLVKSGLAGAPLERLLRA
jgi:hypothetical protein